MNESANESFTGHISSSVAAGKWTFRPVFGTFILLLVMSTNCTILWVFYRSPGLRSPFTVYVINLMVANIFNQLFSQSLNVVQMIRPIKQLGGAFCGAFLYGSYTGHAIIVNSHCLIAMNRVWAIVRPLDYRTYHTERLAVGSALVMWAFVHLVTLPGIIVYALSPEKQHLDQGV